MKASEAAEISQNSSRYTRDIILRDIFGKIKIEATAGKTILSFSIAQYKNIDSIVLINALKELGYEVKRNHGYDQRDNESWDYLAIEW